MKKQELKKFLKELVIINKLPNTDIQGVLGAKVMKREIDEEDYDNILKLFRGPDSY